MTVSVAVQAARKQKQTERLERKAGITDEASALDYANFYANQPMQIERAKLNEAHRAAVEAAKEAADVLAVAEITGVNLEDAKQASAVANLVAERAKPAPRGAGKLVSLGAAT